MNSDDETFVRQVYDAFARADVSAVIAARDPAIRRQEALAALP